MPNSESESASGARRYRAGIAMIIVTLAACVAALVLRTPIRSLLWARQVRTASTAAERAAALTLLCNAGDAARWGTESLLDSADEEPRQLGVIVLQHVNSEWSRRRLTALLSDPSESTAELAALGLAIQGDVSVIPRLKRIYLKSDDGAASAACVALERMGAPQARAALIALAAEPAGAERRAALVDALESVGGIDGARGLLRLLDDDRTVETQPRAVRLLGQLSPLAAAHGLPPPQPTSQPSSAEYGRTVAERAASALARITGLTPTFSSDSPAGVREEAIRAWQAWIDSGGARP